MGQMIRNAHVLGESTTFRWERAAQQVGRWLVVTTNLRKRHRNLQIGLLRNARRIDEIIAGSDAAGGAAVGAATCSALAA